MTLVQPPRWSADDFESARQAAIEFFREQRLLEPLDEYLDAFDYYRGTVEDLMEATVDLTELEARALDVLTDKEMLWAIRYLGGPPISEADLKTVSETDSLAPSRLRADPAMARRVMQTILAALDQRRFPWIVDGREPEPSERDAATVASAALLAYRRVLTTRAHSAKKAQEDAVDDALVAAGFEKIPTPRAVTSLAAAPPPGQFCRETTFGGRKADLLVGLWDDRKMPIECKVSSSGLNSIKRLNNDAAVKAVQWRSRFGTDGVVPSAVLAGVFDLSSLTTAQDEGLAIFWAHDLEALTSWIETTR